MAKPGSRSEDRAKPNSRSEDTAEPSGRIDDGVERGAALHFQFEGKRIPAYQGETVAAALLAAGIRGLRRAEGGPRGLFCGMGICFECRMTIDGRANIRACMTPVRDGMRAGRG
ncbi:MAG: (2Fe-2S)-binding protein [SAR324 cluster bacterium]|nr:(2Fe-2S)-binding protein [SAR324 cluster bacterium]